MTVGLSKADMKRKEQAATQTGKKSTGPVLPPIVSEGLGSRRARAGYIRKNEAYKKQEITKEVKKVKRRRAVIEDDEEEEVNMEELMSEEEKREKEKARKTDYSYHMVPGEVNRLKKKQKKRKKLYINLNCLLLTVLYRKQELAALKARIQTWNTQGQDDGMEW